MVCLTFKYNNVLIPLDVPCESNTQNTDNKRLKIGCTLRWGKKIISPWEDLGNPKFPHILFTLVIICNCDKSVITKSHVILVFGHPFFISRKEQLDRFQKCKGYLYQVMVTTQTACSDGVNNKVTINELDYFHLLLQPLT